MHEVRGSSPCAPIGPGDRPEMAEVGPQPVAEEWVSDGETIFDKILSGAIPCDKVLEDDRCVVIRDINPAAPTHLLVIPKLAGETLEAYGQEAELLGHLLLAAARAAAVEGLVEGGYRIVINNGSAAGQEVMHLHLHVLGGRPFEWPPG